MFIYVLVRRPILNLSKPNSAPMFRNNSDNVNLNRPKMSLPNPKPIDFNNEKTRYVLKLFNFTFN